MIQIFCGSLALFLIVLFKCIFLLPNPLHLLLIYFFSQKEAANCNSYLYINVWLPKTSLFL